MIVKKALQPGVASLRVELEPRDQLRTWVTRDMRSGGRKVIKERPSKKSPQGKGLTESASQKGPHRKALSERPSKKGPQIGALTERPSEKGLQRKALRKRPQKDPPRKAL